MSRKNWESVEAAASKVTIVNVADVTSMRISSVDGYQDESGTGFLVECVVMTVTGSVVALRFKSPDPAKLKFELDRNLDMEAEVAQWLGNPLPTVQDIAAALVENINTGAPIALERKDEPRH